jgi:hypothetical protein
MEERAYIMRHALHLGGNQYEIPSVAFVEACAMTRAKGVQGLSPDWQYHWLSWASVWGLPSSFDDLGYRHPDEFETEETRALAWTDADGAPGEDPNEAVQTTIFSLTE